MFGEQGFVARSVGLAPVLVELVEHGFVELAVLEAAVVRVYLAQVGDNVRQADVERGVGVPTAQNHGVGHTDGGSRGTRRGVGAGSGRGRRRPFVVFVFAGRRMSGRRRDDAAIESRVAEVVGGVRLRVVVDGDGGDEGRRDAELALGLVQGGVDVVVGLTAAEAFAAKEGVPSIVAVVDLRTDEGRLTFA